jgi:hypothetical protein
MAKSASNEKNFGRRNLSFANLPQEVTVREWPKQRTFDEEYDDSITGIDEATEHCRGKSDKYRAKKQK